MNQAMLSPRTVPGREGFTLIEVLVVIGLIALLTVALLPQIAGGTVTAKIMNCRTVIQQLVSAVDAYESQRRFGDYPPDDFGDPTYKVTLGNSINIGIESLMAFLHRPDSREQGVLDLEEFFSNTDSDKASRSLGKLDRVDMVEIKDPWSNPLAYFHNRNYAHRQTYEMSYEDDGANDAQQLVEAWKKDSRYLNPGRFQIFSAGPDGVFNTSDDVGNFETPQEDSD